MGCGSSTSSESSTQGPSGDVATHQKRPAAAPTESPNLQHKPSGNEDHGGGRAAAPLPQGVPLNATDPRVRRAIAGLLHPQSTGHGQEQERPEEPGSSQSKGDKNQVGVVEQILKDLRRRIQQAPTNRHPSHHDSLPNILEMLK